MTKNKLADRLLRQVLRKEAGETVSYGDYPRFAERWKKITGIAIGRATVSLWHKNGVPKRNYTLAERVSTEYATTEAEIIKAHDFSSQ